MKFRMIFLLLLILITNCFRNTEKKEIETINKTYYKTEIINENFLNIYGNWKLKKIETGWGCPDLEFDYLEIKPYGFFSITRNDSIILNGKIEIIIQDTSRLKINFDSDSETKLEILKDSEKWIEFDNDNKMWMIAPCCDRANYLLKKTESTTR